MDIDNIKRYKGSSRVYQSTPIVSHFVESKKNVQAEIKCLISQSFRRSYIRYVSVIDVSYLLQS